jgi:hypothetical protein
MSSSSTSATTAQLGDRVAAQRPSSAVLNRYAASSGDEFVAAVKETVVLALNSDYDAVFGVLGITVQRVATAAYRASTAVEALLQTRLSAVTERTKAQPGATREVTRTLAAIAAGSQAVTPLQSSVELLMRTSRTAGGHTVDDTPGVRLARLQDSATQLRVNLLAMLPLIERFSSGVTQFAELGLSVDTASTQAAASLAVIQRELNDRSGNTATVSALISAQLVKSRLIRQDHQTDKATVDFTVTDEENSRGFTRVVLTSDPAYGCTPREGDQLWSGEDEVGRVVSRSSTSLMVSGWTLGICDGSLDVRSISAVNYRECAQQLRALLLGAPWLTNSARDEFFRLLTVNIESGTPIAAVREKLEQLLQLFADIRTATQMFTPSIVPAAQHLLRFLKSERMDLVADMLVNARFAELSRIDATQLSMQTRIETLQRELQAEVAKQLPSTQQDGTTAILGVEQNRL